MNEVINWMLSNVVYLAWVGAKDRNNDDDIKWIDYGESIDARFWIPGQQEHTRGNCVYIRAFSGNNKGLGLDNCDTESYYLCRWYNA